MKIKQWLYLTNPDGVLRGSSPRFTLDHEGGDALTAEFGWVPLNEIELDVTIDNNQVVSALLAHLDTKEQCARHDLAMKLSAIESRRSDLRAISHVSDSA